MIPKSEVGVLSLDSNNVVELIKTAYSVSSQLSTRRALVILEFFPHSTVIVYSMTEIIF